MDHEVATGLLHSSARARATPAGLSLAEQQVTLRHRKLESIVRDGLEDVTSGRSWETVGTHA